MRPSASEALNPISDISHSGRVFDVKAHDWHSGDTYLLAERDEAKMRYVSLDSAAVVFPALSLLKRQAAARAGLPKG